jgi:hypothetical protein
MCFYDYRKLMVTVGGRVAWLAGVIQHCCCNTLHAAAGVSDCTSSVPAFALTGLKASWYVVSAMILHAVFAW